MREDLQYTSVNLYKSTFCNVSSLDPGYHILVFQAGPLDGTLYVDYLAYEETSMSSDNQPSPFSETHPTSTSISTGVPTGTPDGPPLVSFHQGVVAAIIGAAVVACALAVITAAVILSFWYRRRLVVGNTSSCPGGCFCSCLIDCVNVVDAAHPPEEGFPSTHGTSFHKIPAQPQAVWPSDPSMASSRSNDVASTPAEYSIDPTTTESLEEHTELSRSRRWRRTFVTLHIDRRALRRKLGV